jgi:hypothetical protein
MPSHVCHSKPRSSRRLVIILSQHLDLLVNKNILNVIWSWRYMFLEIYVIPKKNG